MWKFESKGKNCKGRRSEGDGKVFKMSEKWKLTEEEGSMTIEACAIVPMFLIVIFVVMKVGLYSHDITYINSVIYQWECNAKAYHLTNEQLKEYIDNEVEDGTFGEVDYELTLEEKNGIRQINMKGEVYGFYFEHHSSFSQNGMEQAVSRMRKQNNS